MILGGQSPQLLGGRLPFCGVFLVNTNRFTSMAQYGTVSKPVSSGKIAKSISKHSHLFRSFLFQSKKKQETKTSEFWVPYNTVLYIHTVFSSNHCHQPNPCPPLFPVSISTHLHWSHHSSFTDETDGGANLTIRGLPEADCRPCRAW